MMDDFKPQKPDQPGRPDEGAELQQQTYQGEQSTYDAAPEPVRSDETVAAPVASTKKKSSAKKWLFGGVIVLALTGLGAFSYWQWSEVENQKKANESLQAQLSAANTKSVGVDGKNEPVVPQPVSDAEILKEMALSIWQSKKDSTGTASPSSAFVPKVSYIDDKFSIVELTYENQQKASPAFMFMKLQVDGKDHWSSIPETYPFGTVEEDRIIGMYGFPKKAFGR